MVLVQIPLDLTEIMGKILSLYLEVPVFVLEERMTLDLFGALVAESREPGGRKMNKNGPLEVG